jgi:hypothetical protein
MQRIIASVDRGKSVPVYDLDIASHRPALAQTHPYGVPASKVAHPMDN